MEKSSENKKVFSIIRKDLYKTMWFPLFVTSIVCESAVRAVEALTANTLGDFSDAVFAGKYDAFTADLWILILAVFLSAFLCPFLSYLDDYFTVKYAVKHDRKVFCRYLEKKPEKAALFNSGELECMLEDAPNSYRVILLRCFSTAVSTIGFLAYVTVMLWQKNLLITLIYLVLSLIQLSVPLFFSEKLAECRKNKDDYDEDMSSSEEQICSCPHLLKMWKIMPWFIGKRSNIFNSYHNTYGKKTVKIKNLYKKISGCFSAVSKVILIAFVAGLASKGLCSVGTLASIIVYYGIVLSIKDKIDTLIVDLKELKVERDRVAEIYEDSEADQGKDINGFDCVSADNLSFSYGEVNVFENVIFSLSRGEKIAIIGPNGSGKSTLCKLIAALIEDKSGKLLADRQKLCDINHIQWRRHLSFSTQSSFVFKDSLYENLSMGKKISQEEYDRLINAFGISELDQQKVLEPDTLSGGERQKISIIRALLKDSDLLILDEPGNHLDAESTEILKKEISNYGKSILIVTHDREIAECSDKLVRFGIV